MKARVDHVGVVVASLERTGAFVRDVLGLELTLQPPPLPDGVSTAFYGKGAHVELVQVADATARERRLGDAEARVEHIALEVEDVLALIEQLKAKGVRFTSDEPVRVRENIVVWTVPDTSAGVMWQLFSRARP
ncbi:MAG: VOC family protein [Chloroflexi bacterium]|nr:MAG: VOC family protein [Chloroflexota bacterium]